MLNRVKSLEVVAQTHCLPFDRACPEPLFILREPQDERWVEGLRTNGGQSSSAEMISSQLPSPPPFSTLSLHENSLLFIPAGGDPPILTGRRNAPSFDRLSRPYTGDVAPQGRLNGTTGLPVGLHLRAQNGDDLFGP